MGGRRLPCLRLPGALPPSPPGPLWRQKHHLQPQAPAAPGLSKARLIKKKNAPQGPAAAHLHSICVLLACLPKAPSAGRFESCGRISPAPGNPHLSYPVQALKLNSSLVDWQ